MYGRSIDLQECFISHVAETMASFQPERVLELGSGDGVNILALAVLNPNIKTLAGVDLTKAAVAKSRNMLKSPPYEELMYITGQPQAIIYERLRNRDIRFVEGNMLNLPFGDKSFDFVYSIQAI
jgi:ubiquinone/menaquinone biosynthesis C-methylase UbiE